MDVRQSTNDEPASEANENNRLRLCAGTDCKSAGEVRTIASLRPLCGHLSTTSDVRVHSCRFDPLAPAFLNGQQNNRQTVPSLQGGGIGGEKDENQERRKTILGEKQEKHKKRRSQRAELTTGICACVPASVNGRLSVCIMHLRACYGHGI